MAARVTRTLREYARGRGGVAVVATLEDGLAPAEKQSCARSLQGKAHESRLYAELDLITARLDEPTLLTFSGRDEVQTITRAPDGDMEAVIERHRVSQANLDELVEERAWGLNRMRVPDLWELGIRGTGVIVAHLDTGVHEPHEAFWTRLRYRAVIDLRGNLHHTERMKDKHGHGTHTAGIICGRKVGDQRVGVAPQSRLATVTVMEGGDLIKRLLRALQWVLQLREEGAPIRVVNLSLGFRGWQPAFRPVIKKLQAAEILTVASVGNDGRDSSRSPGNYPETLAVGASDRKNEVWRDSASDSWNSGRVVPDLVAPGVEIPSARRGATTGWRVDRGTSMATAYVAGLAALLFSKHPDAEVAVVRQAILDGCQRLDGVHPSRQGHGLPDAVACLAALDRAMS